MLRRPDREGREEEGDPERQGEVETGEVYQRSDCRLEERRVGSSEPLGYIELWREVQQAALITH